MFEPEIFRKQMYCTEESTCDTVENFGDPRSDSVCPDSDSSPGELCPHFPPGYAPAVQSVIQE